LGKKLSPEEIRHIVAKVVEEELPKMAEALRRDLNKPINRKG
jgi:hypothetical protein